MTLVHIRGKRERLAPILLTPDMKEVMDIIIQCHEKMGVSINNAYFFATITSKEHVRGHDAFRHLVQSRPNLKAPQLLRSTISRKYFTTICQMMELTPSQIQIITKHLGHTFQVHQEYNRVHSDALELAGWVFSWWLRKQAN